METNQLKIYADKLAEMMIEHIGSFILGVIVLLVGWWLINRLVKFLNNLMIKRDVDVSLRPFLVNIAKISLRILLILAFAGMIGIQMTSFIAALGAASLALGLSLQGSLANLAGGVVILLFRPFEVGDFIRADNYEGVVRRIDIFYTYLQTANKRSILIPNGKLANSTVLNASRVGLRDVEAAGAEFEIKVNRDVDIDHVKQVLTEVVTSHEDYIEDPGHDIYIKELEWDYILFNIQAWIKPDHYYKFLHELPGLIKKKFDKEGIESPYNYNSEVVLVKKD